MLKCNRFLEKRRPNSTFSVNRRAIRCLWTRIPLNFVTASRYSESSLINAWTLFSSFPLSCCCFSVPHIHVILSSCFFCSAFRPAWLQNAFFSFFTIPLLSVFSLRRIIDGCVVGRRVRVNNKWLTFSESFPPTNFNCRSRRRPASPRELHVSLLPFSPRLSRLQGLLSH